MKRNGTVIALLLVVAAGLTGWTETGWAQDPILALSTTDLNFGDVRVGSSGQMTVDITNNGDAPLTITSLTENSDQFALIAPPAVPFDINPANSVTLTIEFAPTAMASAAGTLTVESNDPVNPSVQVNLSGRGVDAIIALSTTDLNFGDVRVGSSGEMTVDITNNGDATLTITSLTENSDQFAIIAPPAVPFDINPQAIHTVTVAFTPTARGNVTGTLTINSNDPANPSAQVNLSGRGVDAILALSTTDLNFNDVVVDMSSQMTVDVMNTGDATLTITSLTENSDQFALIAPPAVPFDINPGNSVTLTIEFAPTAMASAAGTLTVESNDPANPSAQVNLSGRGVDAIPDLSTDELDLGDVLVGMTSERGFRLDNHGDATLVVTDVSDDSDQFDVSPPATPPDINLYPDQYQIFSVTFAPTSVGVKEATLTLSHHAEVAFKPLTPPPASHVMLTGKALERGDLTRDTHVNILDIIALVRLILGQDPPPEFETLAFLLADMNEDGAINILDIVRQVNRILGIPPKTIAGPASPVTVSLGETQGLASGQLAIPVTLQTADAVVGVQATFTFDAGQLRVGTPHLVGRAAGMTVQSQLTDGTLRLVVYSATGQHIGAGSGTTLLVPVTVLGDPAATPTLTLAQVLLADRQAQAVPVVVGTGTVKVTPLPTAFALKPNRPNPFNPTTAIAYDVPQAAHIMLAVYNLVGQEVVRLVDDPKTAGRYVVTWDGRNAQGLSAASGVYLYRLTTSAGFSQTRRMTLLK